MYNPVISSKIKKNRSKEKAKGGEQNERSKTPDRNDKKRRLRRKNRSRDLGTSFVSVTEVHRRKINCRI